MDCPSCTSFYFVCLYFYCDSFAINVCLYCLQFFVLFCTSFSQCYRTSYYIILVFIFYIIVVLLMYIIIAHPPSKVHTSTVELKRQNHIYTSSVSCLHGYYLKSTSTK